MIYIIMLIPNYDNLINKNKNNFKQLYDYMPSKTFKMLICGLSGSGNNFINIIYKFYVLSFMIFYVVFLF